MHAACWLNAHISESPRTKKPPLGWLVNESPLRAGMVYSMKPSSRSASVSWVYSASSISSVPSGP